VIAAVAVLCLPPTLPAAADDTAADQQAAFAAAVDRVAPAVVQIETVGGLERVEGVLLGTGPTTGLAVDPSGYIISSAFNFIGSPASILVRLPDGARKPARLVATDHARMLVLLKIDAQRPLPTCEIAPRRQMRVGQWTIAVGRTFQGGRPNIAVGILSAIDRVWGRAIQTDAAVSPNNYGGPLVDVRGRVMGVLVPLSPQAAGEVAGMEWYDSGIGFAVPAEDIQRMLPRLKKGEDLYPGLAGFTLKGPNQFTGPPLVAACRPECPAATAGIKVGDLIVELAGRPITRAVEVRDELGRRYAGDKLSVTVLRGRQLIKAELELAAKLEPFQHGFLGILPIRSNVEKGVAVRYVYPNSPAAAVGIAAGDVLVSLAGEPLRNRLELRQKIGMSEPGSEVDLELRRADSVRKVKAILAALPEGLPPDELPPASESSKDSVNNSRGLTAPGAPGIAAAPAKPAVAVGAVPLKIPEYANEVWAYVPASYDPTAAYGVVVWLHDPGGFDWKELFARWQPKSSDPSRWMPAEAALVDRLLAHLGSTYRVDPARVVVHGYEGGGAMAFLAAFHNREAIRAVAAVEAAPVGPPPENDPLHRLAVYLAWGHNSPAARPIGQAAAALRRMKIPVTAKSLDEMPRYLNADELSQLARWIDMLDRI
jgi:serine protease Do